MLKNDGQHHHAQVNFVSVRRVFVKPVEQSFDQIGTVVRIDWQAADRVEDTEVVPRMVEVQETQHSVHRFLKPKLVPRHPSKVVFIHLEFFFGRKHTVPSVFRYPSSAVFQRELQSVYWHQSCIYNIHKITLRLKKRKIDLKGNRTYQSQHTEPA